jgi:hypothetical protein
MELGAVRWKVMSLPDQSEAFAMRGLPCWRVDVRKLFPKGDVGIVVDIACPSSSSPVLRGYLAVTAGDHKKLVPFRPPLTRATFSDVAHKQPRGLEIEVTMHVQAVTPKSQGPVKAKTSFTIPVLASDL